MLNTVPLLLSGLLLALVTVFAPETALADGHRVGELVTRVGVVGVLRDAGAGTLEPGDPIFEQDLIVTGARARAKVRLVDGTTLSIGADSQLSVLEYLTAETGDRRRGFLSLLTGIVRAIVSPDEDQRELDIDTQVAVASVRSTDLMVEAAMRGTAVVTLEGEVAVTSKPPGPVETVVLTDGIGTDVPPDGPPSSPARWGAARVSDFLDRTRVD